VVVLPDVLNMFRLLGLTIYLDEVVIIQVDY
jgi:hypothetical protein